MAKQVSLLIIGAGPFGLAMAAYAKHLNIDYLIVGFPMNFWKSHMPKGMFLRSGCDWHLDPLDVHTIDNYLLSKNLNAEDVEPLSLEFYLSYAKWFQEQKQIEIIRAFVQQLDYANVTNNLFEATLDNGETITANNVLLALGLLYFKNLPEELTQILPAGRFSHSCDWVDFESLRGKRCLIVGGRQSAFEWAALLHEQGAATIDISHRHETPAFEEADWSWMNPLVDAMVTNPGWFRNLSPEQKEEVNQRLWAEGRLKLEAWLKPRINKDTIKLWPKSRVVACDELPTGELQVRLDVGEVLSVDHVILATGYKVNIEQIPFLAKGNILAGLKRVNGYPKLDEHFQSNIPGLFFTSVTATQDFGPFFGFTIAVRTSAKIIGSSIKKKLANLV